MRTGQRPVSRKAKTMEHLFPIQYSYLIPLAPLIGAIIAGFFGAKWLKGKSHWPIWLGVGFAALLSICLCAEMHKLSLEGSHEAGATTLPAGAHDAHAEAASADKL